MTFFRWLDSYSVGVKEMDAQHRQLLELLEQLNESLKNGASEEVKEKIISSLIGFMVAHFAAEEKIMQKYGYPGLPDHHRTHADIAAKIKILNARHEKLSSAVNPEFMTFLRTWLVSHIQGEDQAYGRFIAGR